MAKDFIIDYDMLKDIIEGNIFVSEEIKEFLRLTDMKPFEEWSYHDYEKFKDTGEYPKD